VVAKLQGHPLTGLQRAHVVVSGVLGDIGDLRLDRRLHKIVVRALPRIVVQVVKIIKARENWQREVFREGGRC